MKPEGDPVQMNWIIQFYPKIGLDGAHMGTSQTKKYKCIGSKMVNDAQDWSWVKIFFDLPNKLIPSGDYLFNCAFFTSFPRIALSIHSIVKHRVHVWLGEGGRARIKLIKVLFVIVMRAAGTGRRSLSEKLVTSFEYNLDVNCRFWLSRWGDVPAAGCGDDGCLLWQLLTVHCPPAAASTHAHMGDYS